MTDTPFRVKQIDHVELYVPDQYEAAGWYRQVFGLEILTGFEHWAADGPLMISSDDGHTKLALFRGEPPGFKPPEGNYMRHGAKSVASCFPACAHNPSASSGQALERLCYIFRGTIWKDYATLLRRLLDGQFCH